MLSPVNMLIGTGTLRLKLVRRREVDSLKGSFIPNSKGKTLILETGICREDYAHKAYEFWNALS